MNPAELKILRRSRPTVPTIPRPSSQISGTNTLEQPPPWLRGVTTAVDGVDPEEKQREETLQVSAATLLVPCSNPAFSSPEEI